jgi:uncharacterized protein (DUF697 family)
MSTVQTAELNLIPGNEQAVAAVRERCRQLVRKRAAIAAGFSAIPVPGLDIVSDISLFTQLVDEINSAFGLSQAQVSRLQPKYRLMVYEAAVGAGGMLVGRLVTRELLMTLFKKVGVRIASKTAAKLVPVAGSVVSAAIGFAVFRKLGNQHVEACAKVAEKVNNARTVATA